MVNSTSPNSLPGRPARILLCVSGSISAYKAADLVSSLRKRGLEVRCLLTAGGEKFVSRIVLETLSGHPVLSELFPHAETTLDVGSGGTEHIRLARWADLVVFAPASANLLARLAHGFADDLVTSVALATRAPCLIAPAMNTAMWEHGATQANVDILEKRGAQFIAPAEGVLACGEEGAGKLAPVEVLEAQILARLSLLQKVPSPNPDQVPQKILITAGPTVSRIDAVRYLTNPSTGKMGAALAEAALARGHVVHYILGIDKGVIRPRVPLASHGRFHLTEVETAEEMRDAALRALPQVDGVIATAAVLDYRVADPAPLKRKRSAEPELLTLLPAADVLRSLREAARPGQWFCGFAAETDSLEVNALKKIDVKRLDFLFANSVAATGEKAAQGFGTDANGGLLFKAGTPIPESFPLQPKATLAAALLDRLLGEPSRC